MSRRAGTICVRMSERRFVCHFLETGRPGVWPSAHARKNASTEMGGKMPLAVSFLGERASNCAVTTRGARDARRGGAPVGRGGSGGDRESCRGAQRVVVPQ